MTRAPVLLAVVLLLAELPFAQLIVSDPLLTRDDEALLAPLRQVTSPADYAALLSTHRVLDVQPVRDVSYLVDLWLSRRLPFSTFHLTGAVLFALLLVSAFGLFARLAPWPRALVAVAVMAAHPVWGTGVAWVAARKHLLAALFLTLATVALLRYRERETRREGVFAVLAFTLSVLSQPIGVGWPLFAFVLLGRRLRGPVVASALVAAGVAAVNAWYYTGPYVAQADAAKFAPGLHPGVSLLSLGRAFWNLVCPVAIATSYEPGAVWNLAGLLLLVPVLFVLLRAARWRRTGPWLLYAALPLGVVLVRMTNVFLFDTYLFSAGVGLLAAVLCALEAATLPVRRAAAVFAGGLISLGLVEDVALARSYTSEPALWARAWAVEPSPEALAHHAAYELDAGRVDASLALALRLRDWAPERKDVGWVLGRAIDRSATADKETLFRTAGVDDPWLHYFHARFEASQGRWPEADALLQRALQHPERFKRERELVEAEARVVCQRAGRCPP